jgi:hypothetical protein
MARLRQLGKLKVEGSPGVTRQGAGPFPAGVGWITAREGGGVGRRSFGDLESVKVAAELKDS